MKISITETCLYAESLDAAEHFYSDVMGFELVMKEEGRHLFYKCDNGMLLIFNPIIPQTNSLKLTAAPFRYMGQKARGISRFQLKVMPIKIGKRNFATKI